MRIWKGGRAEGRGVGVVGRRGGGGRERKVGRVEEEYLGGGRT